MAKKEKKPYDAGKSIAPAALEYVDLVREAHKGALERYAYFLSLRPSPAQRRQYADPELVSAVCELLRKCIPLRYAIVVLGVDQNTISGWRQRDAAKKLLEAAVDEIKLLPGVETELLPGGGFAVSSNEGTEGLADLLHKQATTCATPDEALAVAAQIAALANADPPLKAIERAEAEAVAANVMSIRNASDKQWTAAAWLLERLYPVDFSKTVRGQDGGREDGKKVVIYVRTAVPRNEQTLKSRLAALGGSTKAQLPSAADKGPAETRAVADEDFGEVIDVEAREVEEKPKIRRRGE